MPFPVGFISAVGPVNIVVGRADNALAWSPTVPIWVAAGTTIETSDSGAQSWTARTETFSASILDVAWSPSVGVFCAVGFNNGIETSPDGVTWTARTSGIANSPQWKAVVWSPGLSLFVAFGYKSSGAVPFYATSPTGTTWTERSSTLATGVSYDESGLAWAPSLTLLVCVTSDGKMETSPDGTTWTSRTSSFSTTHIRNVCWSADLSLFVAVGAAGKIATSSNGTAWTQRTSGLGAVIISDVCWDDHNNLFIAVSNGTAISSPDGTTWSSYTTDPTTFEAGSSCIAAGMTGAA